MGDSGFLTTGRGETCQHSRSESEGNRALCRAPPENRASLAPTVLHVQIDVDLLQGHAHTGGFGVRDHDEFDVGRRFVVVQLVLAGAVGDEAGERCQSVSFSGRDGLRRKQGRLPIILAAQFAHHVPQGVDGAED